MDKQGTPEVEFYIQQTFGHEEMHLEGSILAEIKNLKEKLKIIEQHLSHYVSGVNSTPSVSNHSDHEILEQFHGVETAVMEKWSPLEISVKLQSALISLSNLQSKILTEELLVWKREQQLSKNGFEFTKYLDNIQCLLVQLLELHNISHHEINQLGQIYHTQQFKEYSTNLINSLLNGAFIVEIQPPQVIKVKTKFSHSVNIRLLLGPKLLHIMNKPQVKVSIISEVQARVVNPNVYEKHNSGVIANAVTKMDLTNLTAEFNNLKLLDVERKTKKGSQQGKNTVQHHLQQGIEGTLVNSVTDEKFCLHFQTEIRINSVDYKLSTTSLPVVVVTHGVQEPQAWATITWDNGFSNPYRLPFEIPQSVSWNILSQTLSQKFQSLTGKGLELRELETIQAKLVIGEILDCVGGTVSHIRLFKRPLEPSSGENFSFWDWYWNALKLVEKYGSRTWKNGWIYGFVGRTEAEAVLQSSQPGTFLMRFSDTVLGGISICYVASTGKVFSLLPFTSKNFSFRSLTETIWDLENLHTLYPNIPKHIAFPRTTPQPQTITLPNISSSSSSSSFSGNNDQSASSEHQPSQYIVSYPKITIPVQFS